MSNYNGEYGPVTTTAVCNLTTTLAATQKTPQDGVTTTSPTSYSTVKMAHDKSSLSSTVSGLIRDRFSLENTKQGELST